MSANRDGGIGWLLGCGVLIGIAIGAIVGWVWAGGEEMIVYVPPPTRPPEVTTIYVGLNEPVVVVLATETPRPTSTPDDVVLTPNPPLTTTPLATLTPTPAVVSLPVPPIADDGGQAR